MPESDTAPKLDDETSAALTLFNEYVEADRERTNREKRIKKAERAKDEAAAVVKKLNERGSATEKAEAEAAYRDAADRWKKLRDGEEPDEPAPAAEAAPVDDEAAPVDEAAPAPTDESAAPADDDEEEEPPVEAASDEEE
ncbi:MAG: hypothetical protein R2707_10740 [Acidimicrobiales bacterium]